MARSNAQNWNWSNTGQNFRVQIIQKNDTQSCSIGVRHKKVVSFHLKFLCVLDKGSCFDEKLHNN